MEGYEANGGSVQAPPRWLHARQGLRVNVAANNSKNENILTHGEGEILSIINTHNFTLSPQALS